MWNVKKTINTEKGSVLTLTALLLPVLFAFMGIAYDLGYLYMQKTTFQNIADAAALAGLEELKDPEKLGGTGKLVLSMPIGTTTDFTTGERSPLSIADSGAIPYFVKNARDLDIAANSERKIYHIAGSNREDHYYYEVIVKKDFPLFFASIIHPEPITVRAGALVHLIHPFDESQLSGLEKWGKIGKEELYNSETSQDVVNNEERLATDRKSLITIAQNFLEKNKTEIETQLGYTIDNKKFYGTTNGTANGTEGDIRDKQYSAILMEYFDPGTTGKNIFYNNSEVHISSQWLNGVYTNANDDKSWRNYRYFYSNEMIQANPFLKHENDDSYTYSNKIKTRFETDKNGNVTAVRIFVLRQATKIGNNNSISWQSGLDNRELVEALDITVEKQNGVTVAYLDDNGTRTYIDTSTGKTATL